MKKRGLISTDNHIRQVPMENFHWHLKTTNYTTMAYLFPTSDLVLKFPGVKRHGALLCAHKGADLNTYLVSLRYWHASHDGCTEGACERIAGTDGISHLHLGRSLETHVCGCQDIRAKSATGHSTRKRL